MAMQSGFIKRIRDIMRMDAGINGDAQRIEQMVWMLFLKVYDAKEDDWELNEDNYESIIPEDLRWRNWAKADENGHAMTGDKLLSFVNNTLFPVLKGNDVKESDTVLYSGINVTPDTPIKKAIVKSTFEDANNYMKDGVYLRQVIDVIDEIEFDDVNLRLRAINCYLECIGKEKWKLPFVRVQQKTFLENVISEADYKYFKSCLKNDDEMFWYFVIRFLAATGARVSELIQIKAEHVKLGHLDLYSKGGKLRRIYIPKELQNEALSWLADKQQESGFIFLNKYGERITTRGISGQLKKLAVKYGINPAVVYPHSFRHRFAKSFLDRCNDIAFLADLMGHESIETTRIYLRKTATEQREIVDTIIDW